MKRYLNFIGTPNETIEIREIDNDKKIIYIWVHYLNQPTFKRWFIKRSDYNSFLKMKDKTKIKNEFEREELDRILEIILERNQADCR